MIEIAKKKKRATHDHNTSGDLNKCSRISGHHHTNINIITVNSSGVLAARCTVRAVQMLIYVIYK